MRKAAGIVEGTGATLNVSCGFKPDKVTIINKTTNTKVECLFTRVTSATDSDGDGAKEHTETVTSHGFNVAAAGTRTAMASAAAGLAQYAGSPASAGEGFTIGASAVPNVDGDDIVWEAEQFD